MTDQQRDKYLQRTFGITLAEYNEMLAKQGGVCAFCGRPPGKKKLSVDHAHVWDKLKIKITEMIPMTAQTKPFLAWAVGPNGYNYCGYGADKKESRINLERVLCRMSVRAILCLRCNKALALLEDSKAPRSTIERLEYAVKYLKEYEARMKKGLDKTQEV